jgi:hypothetical protein
MVSVDIARGAELLRALGRSNVKVAVRIWMFLSEFEDWRLFLAARQFDSMDLRQAYGLVHDSLAGAGITAERTPPITILPMTDPFIKDLRRRFGKTESAEGMRISGRLIANRFIEDAYVYKIS